MTKKLNKRGFTIVELVVVIVVIAILAAVLIPTVSSLINKANRSADEQAVAQMNKALAIKEVTDTMDITKVYDALEELGMNAKDYTPLAKDCYFFWNAADNRIIYVDETDTVVAPTEYAGKALSTFSTLFSLNCEIRGDSSYKDSVKTDNGTTTISVNSGAQLYQAVQDLEKSSEDIQLKGSQKDGTPAITTKFKNSINTNTTITLTTDIDLMGGSFSIGAVAKNVNLVIDGGGHTVKNISNLDNGIDSAALNSEGKERNYYSGLIKYVDNNATVTIKNINFENIVGGKSDVGSSGLLIGNVRQNCAINFEKVTISNSTLYGKNKLGALVGALAYDSDNVTVKDVKLNNVHIISSEGEAGILFGSTSNSNSTKNTNNIKIDKSLFGTNGEINFITNCSVVCTSTDVIDATPTDGWNKTLDGKLVKKCDEEAYRVTTAFLGFDGTDNAYPNATNFNPINTYEQAVAAGWVYDFTGDGKVVTND